MKVLFVVIVLITVSGVVLLGTMFKRDDSRLGMAALTTLIVADVMAMVYSALDQ